MGSCSSVIFRLKDVNQKSHSSVSALWQEGCYEIYCTYRKHKLSVPPVQFQRAIAVPVNALTWALSNRLHTMSVHTLKHMPELLSAYPKQALLLFS